MSEDDPEPHGEIIVHAEVCEKIEDFCARLIKLTWEAGIELTGRHNDVWLHARMGMTREQVMEPYTRRGFDSYFGDGEYDRRKANGRGSG